jgi:hypothetical protein
MVSGVGDKHIASMSAVTETYPSRHRHFLPNGIRQFSNVRWQQRCVGGVLSNTPGVDSYAPLSRELTRLSSRCRLSLPPRISNQLLATWLISPLLATSLADLVLLP